LGNFRWRVILSSQFTLLLFRLNLASSILSFVTGLRFVVRNLCKKPLLKDPLAVIYCDCFQTFVERQNLFGKDTDKLLAEILPGVLNVCDLYMRTGMFTPILNG